MNLENHRKFPLILLGFFLLFLCTGTFLYFWFFGFWGLSGILYISSPDKSGHSNLYRYSPREHSFSSLWRLKEKNDRISEAVIRPSDNGSFARLNRDKFGEETIRLVNSSEGTVITFSHLGKSPKKNLSWSPEGKRLAYASFIGSDEDRTIPESWTFFVINPVGVTEFVSRGKNPVFLSEDKLFVIKNDGLYLLSVSSAFQNIEKIWSMVGGKAHSAMSLAISKDRKYLAWSNPLESKVFLFKITNDFHLVFQKTIPIRAYDLVFSPRTRYLALHEALVPGSDGKILKASSVFVFNILSLQKKKLFELPGLSLANISDWQKE